MFHICVHVNECVNCEHVCVWYEYVYLCERIYVCMFGDMSINVLAYVYESFFDTCIFVYLFICVCVFSLCVRNLYVCCLMCIFVGM